MLIFWNDYIFNSEFMDSLFFRDLNTRILMKEILDQTAFKEYIEIIKYRVDKI